MIDFYYWPTPNGWKVAILLEEMMLPYRLVPVNLRAGDQNTATFTAINPNQRVPAIVDHGPHRDPMALAESGAILIYLAEKTGRFLPVDTAQRFEVIQWVMWQMSALGPTLGQLRHYRDVATVKSDVATDRFAAEANRLYGIMDRRLKDRPYLAGEYSIADIACWTFITPYERHNQTLDAFPNVKRWSDAILARPAVRRALDVGAEWRRGGPLDAHVKALLLGSSLAKVA